MGSIHGSWPCSMLIHVVPMGRPPCKCFDVSMDLFGESPMLSHDIQDAVGKTAKVSTSMDSQESWLKPHTHTYLYIYIYITYIIIYIYYIYIYTWLYIFHTIDWVQEQLYIARLLLSRSRNWPNQTFWSAQQYRLVHLLLGLWTHIGRKGLQFLLGTPMVCTGIVYIYIYIYTYILFKVLYNML